MLSAGSTARVKTTTSDIHEHTNDLITVKRRDSQLLFGERFEIELIDGDWAFGKSVNDGYEGFVALSTLEPADGAPTHSVSNILSHIYGEPTFKIRPTLQIGFKSELICSDIREKGFAEISGKGWIPEGHIRRAEAPCSLVDTALMFEGAPYLYGGRSALGLDCSGLTQVVLQACGTHCPRDSDMQLAQGRTGKLERFEAGDLVFFDAHVGIMIDETHILNATARTMDTRIEKLSDLEDIYNGILGHWKTLP